MKNRIIKSTLSVLLVLSLFLGLLPAVSPVAEAAYGYAGWLPDGVYEISAKLETNYVWDLDTTGVTDTTYYNRSPLIVAPRDGSNSQKWVLRSYGDGTYTFRNLQYNNWLNVDAGKEKLHIYRASSSTTGSSKDMDRNYRFRLHYNPDGTYSFESVERAGANNPAYATMKQGGNTITASAADATANITHFYITPVGYSYGAFDNGGTFYMRFASHSGFAMGISGDSTGEAEPVVVAQADDAKQRFIIEPTSDGHYAIRANVSGRLLTIADKQDTSISSLYGSSTVAGFPVSQKSTGAASTVNEKWNVVPMDDGTFVIVSCKTGGALDSWYNTAPGNGTFGANVRIGTWEVNYGGTQLFNLSNAANSGLNALADGDTGIYADTFDPSDTISFPIEIYDYLNDGMLFEYGSSTEDSSNYSYTIEGTGTESSPIATVRTTTDQNCKAAAEDVFIVFGTDAAWKKEFKNLQYWVRVICDSTRTVKKVVLSGTSNQDTEYKGGLPRGWFAVCAFVGNTNIYNQLAQAKENDIVTFTNGGGSNSDVTITRGGVSENRSYKMGNNRGFGLLFPSNGGQDNTTAEGSWNQYLYFKPSNPGYDVTNAPLVEKSIGDAFSTVNFTNAKNGTVDYSTDISNALGYQLFSKMTAGLATVGLIEPYLGADGNPVYTDEAVTYVAQLLYSSLPIPEKNTDGTYNYNFVQGAKSNRYGEGKDLAQALRECLSPSAQFTKSSYTVGSKANSGDRLEHLRGVSWNDAESYILTCYDAAYYLLNSLFAPASYHEDVKNETDFTTLKLTKATTTAGKVGYIFDAGFSDSSSIDKANSAVKYDHVTKTISNTSAVGKTMFYYDSKNTTTYYPFLPLRDSSGKQAMTNSPYFADDGVGSTSHDRGTYVNRNYNYVLKSTGRFVYEPDKDLFFDFEGDDDVYLFINGQLVLDIGGAHSITKVEMSLNDYVNWAWGVKNNTDAYNDLSKENQARVDALALEAGESYDFDFFYMERHGFGANMRIFTNISLSNKNATTVKHAYQDGELQNNTTVNPNALVEYGFSIENTGNEDLTDFTFTDNDLGVTISHTGGLKIDETAIGGATLVNAAGAKLTAEDLVVTHYLRDGTAKEYTTNSGAGLKNILGNAIVLRADEKILVRGIYVKDIAQIPQMKSESKLRNTVQTVCYANGQPLTSQADFTVYIPASPMYYQWAAKPTDSGYDRGLLLSQDQFVQDVIAATKETDNPLYGQGSGLEKGVQSMTVCTASGANYNNPYLAIDSNNNIQIKYQKTGAYTAFIKIVYNYNETTGNSSTIVVPLQIYVFDVPDQSFVLDYGLKARVGDPYAESGQYSITGVDTTYSIEAFRTVADGKAAPSFNNSVDRNHIVFTPDTANADGEYKATYGTFSASTTESGSASFTYRPTAFMEGLDSVYTAVRIKSSSYNPETVALGTVDIHNEVELYYKTTIVPASIVYYEDDFPAINYYNKEGQVVTSISADGKGSSDLYQSVDNSEQYGHDATYENGGMEMSGNSGHEIDITATGVVADFTFQGTGFELIGRTNATDNCVMYIDVWRADDTVKTKPVRRIPVILEYDNGGNGGNEGIYQVPIIRVEGLEYGAYTVEINGLKPYSGDGVTRTSKLFIDGVRIFRPILGSDLYTTEEKNAEIVELRSLIVKGTALVSELKKDGITVSGGTSTFTENRNNMNFDGSATYKGNTVTSVNDYLTLGPNNEVYLDGISKKQAVILYVKPTGKLEDAYLQVGVHALDPMKIAAGIDGQITAGNLQQSYLTSDSTKAWTEVGPSITSATEQYYRIDLSSLSQRDDGAYEVVLYAAGGMLSLTSIKYSGLTIKSCGGKAATYAYQGGVLVKLEDNGTTTPADPASLPDFASLSVQLRSTQMVEPKPDTEHIFVPGEPDADPEDPVDPVDPVDPEDPVDPADPVDPVDPADPADPEAPVFTDVSGQWYEKEVNALAALGIVNGYADGSFGGNRSITRAEFVTMLVRAFDLAAPAGYVSPFTDVSGWSKPYVDAAAACGVVNGVTETTFAPDEPITREQMMTMIYRVQQYCKLTIEKAAQTPVLKDLDQVSLWAKVPVNALIETGLILGDENQCLRPQSNCTRAECAVVLYRLLDKSQQKED